MIRDQHNGTASGGVISPYPHPDAAMLSPQVPGIYVRGLPMDVIGAEAKALLKKVRELGRDAANPRDVRQLHNELQAAGRKADRILRATHYQGVLNEAEKEASDQAPAARG